MFTRYTLFTGLDGIADHYEVKDRSDVTWEPAYNVSPGTAVPVIFPGHAMERTMKAAVWGGIPGIGASAAVADLRKFPENMRLVQRKRCILPVNGFYEWKKIGETISLPFYVRMLTRPFFSVAGIYDKLENEDGTNVMVCSALLTTANSLLEPLSEYMPAILDDEDVSDWLNPLESDVDKSLKLITPARVTQMASFRVGSEVNDIGKNSKSLIQPVM